MPIGRLIDLIAHVAVPGLFVLFVWLWHPFHEVFEFDPDEGIEVTKALMVAEGHPLYSETWSDHPPLHSYMLRGWFAFAGWTVGNGRLMVLLCSGVLLWALYHTVRPVWGRLSALAAVFMLICSYRYLALSVAVMQAIPTLMFAMLAIYALVRFRQKPRAMWALASGASMVLSLLTKLITLPVAAPLFAVVVHTAWSTRGTGRHRQSWLRPVLLWSGGFVGVGAVVVLLTIPFNEVMQLIRPHLSAQEKMAAAGFDDVFRNMVKADYAVALLGLVGLLRILGKRHWFSLLAVAWCVMFYGLLWHHRPLYYHHYSTLAVPLCWTAGIGAGAILSMDTWRAALARRGLRSAFAALVLLLSLCFGVLAAARVPAKLQAEHRYASRYIRMTPGDLYTTAVLRQFKGRTDCVVTDRQMLAFSAGIMVPPELSVTSVKRMRTGSLSMETLISLLEEYNPGVVHLSWRGRIPLTRELKGYLKARYVPLYANDRGGRTPDRCFVRTDLNADRVAVLAAASAEVPQSWEGHHNLGVQLAAAGRHGEAVRSFRSSITIKFSVATARGLGTSLEQIGAYGEAADVHEHLARVLTRNGRDREADHNRAAARRLRAMDDG